MISVFNATKRILFFPIRWANAVTIWIQNVRSPDDSIKITNTCNPKEGNSLGLSLNMQKIYDGIKAYFKGIFITPEDLQEKLDDITDNNTIKMVGGKLTAVKVSDEGSTPPTMFKVAATLNSAGTAIASLQVYLPALSIRIGSTIYAIQQGTTTGYVNNGADGWYTIAGITSGTIYLVDCSTTASGGGTEYKAKFATTAITDKMCKAIASVAFSGDVATITQSVQGAMSLNGASGDETERVTGWNENLKASSGGQSAVPSGDGFDQTTWERGKTIQQKSNGSGGWVDCTPATLTGIKLLVVSRIHRISGVNYHYYRWAYFDKNGMLVKLGPEFMCHAEIVGA